MTVYANDKYWTFRSSDVGKISERLLVSLCESVGRVRYDLSTGKTYLFVPGVGHGILEE